MVAKSKNRARQNTELQQQKSSLMGPARATENAQPALGIGTKVVGVVGLEPTLDGF